MKKNFSKKKINKQRGFALVLAILLLVVMSIMGVTLVTLVSSDFKDNDRRDDYQQALYVAETAVNEAKSWIKTKSTLPINSTTPFDGGGVSWCPVSRFSDLPALNKIYLVTSGTEQGSTIGGVKSFSKIISTDPKYDNFEFYWFITYVPVWDTASNSYITTTQTRASSSGSTGGSASESSGYGKAAYASGLYYKIYACARKKTSLLNPFENTAVAALDVLVKASK
jgi:hypothetical protein